MDIIKNFYSLATTKARNDVLNIAEAGLESIQPEKVMRDNFAVRDNTLKIGKSNYLIDKHDNFYLIGFGKGSSGIANMIYKAAGDKLKIEGYVIDNIKQESPKYDLTLGTHPLPSDENIAFARRLEEKFAKIGKRDVVMVVACGGGSAMLSNPAKISGDKYRDFTTVLLRSGAAIHESNTMRKHLDKMKGGGLAEILYDATVPVMIFSDVPGNDLSVVASGPTVYDYSILDDAWNLIKKYNIDVSVGIRKDDLIETPKDKKYFGKVRNEMMLSNRTALNAMRKRAEDLGYRAVIYKDDLQGEARYAGRDLISENKGGVLLAGGEMTVKKTGNGVGGRNREAALSALGGITDYKTVAAFLGSDGWDFVDQAGAIVDIHTIENARKLDMDPTKYLNNNDSGTFFDKVGDAINTGKLPSNVADLYIVLKEPKPDPWDPSRKIGL